MKKFISSLLLLVCSLAQAEYTAENKIIKVVIPQPQTSGLGSLYRHMEAYANKQNIKMIPVFKPGAESKIGIGYASKEKNDGNTLLFSTVSDYVSVNNLDFDAVAPVTKIDLILVASKKSKIKTVNDIVRQEQENPGKLTWAYTSTAQSMYIDNFVKVSNIDINTIYKVPFGSKGGLNGLVNGDADLTMVTLAAAESLKDHLTVIDIDPATKQKLTKKENATGLFLPKNSNSDANKFWNKFVKDLLNDDEFKLAMKSSNIRLFDNSAGSELQNVIDNWKF
jgi:tripartite-type tricarboxylate transporter receptor subunit TctC